MRSIYHRALNKANYKATRYRHMLNEHGGIETAKILIHSPKSSRVGCAHHFYPPAISSAGNYFFILLSFPLHRLRLMARREGLALG